MQNSEGYEEIIEDYYVPLEPKPPTPMERLKHRNEILQEQLRKSRQNEMGAVVAFTYVGFQFGALIYWAMESTLHMWIYGTVAVIGGIAVILYIEDRNSKE